MKAFIEPLQELSGYEDMTNAAMQPGLVTISGCIDAQKPHMIYTLGRTRSRRLIVTFHEQKAKELNAAKETNDTNNGCPAWHCIPENSCYNSPYNSHKSNILFLTRKEL